MASAHRYAIDYIEQAPVIVLAAAGPLAALALPLGLTAAALLPMTDVAELSAVEPPGYCSIPRP